ncbi:MAG: hypothetical protein KDK36_04515, partial [Leptospiraceae bacterium]|nr:hypothetical protein [Leptospiraceae bacterium]
MKKKINIPSVTVPEVLKSIISKKHPWIFQNKFKLIGKKIKPGKFYYLTDENNSKMAMGIYSPDELVGFRIFLFGDEYNQLR